MDLKKILRQEIVRLINESKSNKNIHLYFVTQCVEQPDFYAALFCDNSIDGEYKDMMSFYSIHNNTAKKVKITRGVVMRDGGTIKLELQDEVNTKYIYDHPQRRIPRRKFGVLDMFDNIAYKEVENPEEIKKIIDLIGVTPSNLDEFTSQL